jgi:hypothetical protein
MKNIIFITALMALLFSVPTRAQEASTATATASATQAPAVAPTPTVSPSAAQTSQANPVLLDPNDNSVVQLDDVATAALALVKDRSSLGQLGLAMAIINLIAMLLKTSYVGGWFSTAHPIAKRAVLIGLGQVAGILLAIEGGMGVTAAIFTGLISSGGAVALFEVCKPLLPIKYQTLL